MLFLDMLKFSSSLFLPLLIVSCVEKPRIATELVQKHLLEQCDSLTISLNQLVRDAQQRQDRLVMQDRFRQARYHYKQLEPITELYFSGFSEAINGPAIDESEMYEGKVIEATGFQVVEEYLFGPEEDSRDNKTVLQEIELLASMTNRLRQLLTTNELTDQHVFQALRLELLRIISLGISGFDSPVALESLPEARAALKGIGRILELYSSGSSEEAKEVRAELSKAIRYIASHNNFDAFDRAAFIKNHMQSLSQSIYAFQRSLNISNRRFLSAINLEREDFLQLDAYNIEYFSNPNNRKQTDEVVELGRLLFFDPVLSGNNRRACASCHNPAKAFSDGNVKSLTFESGGSVLRNAPTVINSAYQRMQFYDSRIMFQEDQVVDVISNPTEMHGQMDQAVSRLRASDEYNELFEKAFPNEAITDRSIKKALAAYIRSLSAMNSPFDKYMRGEKVALPEEAVKGFNLFMGKAKCATCHFAPLFNGTVPPMFIKSESEVLGVPQKADTADAQIDADLGKFTIYGGDLNKHAFKTPSIRNAALTAPYMHNGVFSTLEEVIDFYNRGGGAGIGIDLPNQTLPPDPLNLSASEQRSIVSFIEVLTDTIGMTRRPNRLPSLGNAKLDQRKIGGEY